MRKIVLYILLLGSIFGCSQFEELNTNPAQSTKTNIDGIITNVHVSISGRRYVQWRYNYIYGMGFMQMITDGWSAAQGQKYIKTPANLFAMWDDHFEHIQNLRLAITEIEKDESLLNHSVVAQATMCFLFARLTDYYGDIPYFEGGLGYTDQMIFPKYDRQKEIYYDMFSVLENLISLIDQNADDEVKGDAFFGGDMQKWRKFINSLRLRLAMRLVNVDEAKAKEEAQKAIASGLMDSNDDCAVLRHLDYSYSDEERRGNGLSHSILEAKPKMCTTYLDLLKTTNDPRLTMMLGVFGAPDEFKDDIKAFESGDPRSVDVTDVYTTYEGFPPGYFSWDDIPGIGWSKITVTKDGQEVVLSRNAQHMQLRPELVHNNTPFLHLSFTEVELYRAEAALRWGTGDAAVHYENAVRAHNALLKSLYGCPESINGDIDTYLSNHPFDLVKGLQQINEQLYISYILNGTEAFNNWRRSGFPLLHAAYDAGYTDPTLGGLIPRRLPYPDSEILYNIDNMQESLDNGVNNWGAPVWWDGDKNRGVIPN